MSNRVRGLMEGFTSGLLGAGVDAPLFEALGAAAPAADDFAWRLLALLPRLDEKGRFTVAALAVQWADDPGYRPVVETVLVDHPLGATYQPWLIARGARLDGDAQRWWLGVVTDTMPADLVDYAHSRLAVAGSSTGGASSHGLAG